MIAVRVQLDQEHAGAVDVLERTAAEVGIAEAGSRQDDVVFTVDGGLSAVRPRQRA